MTLHLFSAAAARQHEEEARAWLAVNPTAAAWFLARADEFIAARRRFGVKALCEGYRWETRLREEKQGDFKLNNNHTAGIARWLTEQRPQVTALLETRRRAGEAA